MDRQTLLLPKLLTEPKNVKEDELIKAPSNTFEENVNFFGEKIIFNTF